MKKLLLSAMVLLSVISSATFAKQENEDDCTGGGAVDGTWASDTCTCPSGYSYSKHAANPGCQVSD